MLKIIFNTLDSTTRIQQIFAITPREEKIMKRASVPALVVAAGVVFWAASAEAAEPDLTKFFTVHEVRPLIEGRRDADGHPVNIINQVNVLLQLPGERVARRIRVSLQDTLFLDPRAPVPGERRYVDVIGLDGQVEASE